jgi:hypothetical protein
LTNKRAAKDRLDDEWRELHADAKRIIADGIIQNGFASIGGSLHMIYNAWAQHQAKVLRQKAA